MKQEAGACGALAGDDLADEDMVAGALVRMVSALEPRDPARPTYSRDLFMRRD
jgi:hypothetical protein